RVQRKRDRKIDRVNGVFLRELLAGFHRRPGIDAHTRHQQNRHNQTDNLQHLFQPTTPGNWMAESNSRPSHPPYSAVWILCATAARIRALNAASSISSVSWMSMARRTFPSMLELNNPEGSFSEAPLAKVSLTALL